MNDEELREMGESMQREQDGGAVIVVIVLTSILSALAGCAVAWALMKAFGM